MLSQTLKSVAIAAPPDFLLVSPNSKIHSIEDGDRPSGQPISLFELGAILIYVTKGMTAPFLNGS